MSPSNKFTMISLSHSMIIRSILSIASLLAITSLAKADDSIILKNTNTLTGTLVPSDKLGIITLSYPHSEKILKMKESSVDRIVFDDSNAKNTNLTESIQLINGDHFPCTITKLDENNISFTSDTVGSHTLSRNNVSQLKFNTKANKTLYTGPGDDLSAWSTTTEDWKLSNGKLTVLKKSEASKRINNLTENYILEFKTSWVEATPRIRVCFSSNRSQADKNSDFYYIDLNSHGISIYHSKLGRYETLSTVLSDDNIYEKSSIHVAIHVDRKNQKMALYINGKLTKTIIDPKTPPKGDYLIIKNLQRDGILTQISDIKFSSWNGKVTEDLKSKAESLNKHDLITDLKGNIMTGKIITLSRSGAKTNLRFKAPFSKTDAIIPGTAIDILEFKTNDSKTKNTRVPYHLNLVSGGLLSFTNSQMIDGKLSVRHPILGNVSLPRTSLSSVVFIPEAPVKPAKEDNLEKK